MHYFRFSNRAQTTLAALFISITVLVFGFLVMNVIYLTAIGSTVDKLSSESDIGISYKEFSNSLENEKKRLSFASHVQNIKNILEIYRPNTGGLNYMDMSYLIASESFEKGIDPYLVLAVIKTESSFRRHVVSNKGAVGFMQILPGTAFYVSDMHDNINLESRSELFDPTKNIRIGISYLAYLLNKYDNQKYALIAYNMGPGNLNKMIKSGSGVSDKYYRAVMSNYKRIINISARQFS
ncbi:MAG: lytic transglycosylase domain-containing protein [Deferribacterales bacterium]